MRTLVSLILVMLVAAKAFAGSCFLTKNDDFIPPEPVEVGGGWWSCPYGYFIFHHNCFPWHEGPVVEYEPEPGKRQKPQRPWIGNVGYASGPMGAPSGGMGIVIGIGQ